MSVSRTAATIAGKNLGLALMRESTLGAWTASKKGAKSTPAHAFFEGGDGLGMVDGLGIAALGVGHGGFGELGFEGEDVGGVGCGLGGGFAGEGEHLGDVGYVLRRGAAYPCRRCGCSSRAREGRDRPGR